MRKLRALVVLVVLAAGIPTGPEEVRAQNDYDGSCTGVSGAWHCLGEYDLGGTGDLVAVRDECATVGGCPAFSDTTLDVGGIVFDGCSSPSHADNEAADLLDVQNGKNRDWPNCASMWSLVSISITDDLFGEDVGGFFCNDRNGDGDCGDHADGESARSFCGNALESFVPNDVNAQIVLVDGPIFQSLDCPGTLNPVGGTQGTVILWIDDASAPECSDGLDNDSDGETDWSGGDIQCTSVSGDDEGGESGDPTRGVAQIVSLDPPVPLPLDALCGDSACPLATSHDCFTVYGCSHGHWYGTGDKYRITKLNWYYGSNITDGERVRFFFYSGYEDTIFLIHEWKCEKVSGVVNCVLTKYHDKYYICCWILETWAADASWFPKSPGVPSGFLVEHVS